MPITKSAIKRMRQNAKRRQRLLPYRTRMKTMLRVVIDLIRQGKKEEAAKALPSAYTVIDLAVKKRIIHRKTADRRKSRLARMLA